MSARRGISAVFAALGLLISLLGAPTAAQAAVAYPGGRPNFVVSVMGGKINAIGVRLAKYQFSTTGAVSQQYWYWNQNQITGDGNVKWTKPNSGYTTTGCLRVCPIRTPVGFQSGGNGRMAYGKFSVASGVLTITWNSGSVEKWRINNTKPGVAAITLMPADPTARGWGLGSNQGLARAVDMTGMLKANYLTGPFATNAYGVATTYSRMAFNPVDNNRCTGNAPCIEGKYVTDVDKTKWFNSYMATNPAVDGRKIFQNYQNGTITQAEAPGSLCISYGGGHTVAALQALDDAGSLIGMVGVEASLNQPKINQDIVSAFGMAVYRYQVGTNVVPLLS